MYVFLFNTLLLLTIAHIKVAVTMILLLFSVFTSIYQPMYVIFSRPVYDVCRGQLLEHCDTLNYVLKRSQDQTITTFLLP